jgi:translation initiation factor eIF-2B subunit epsilon
MKSTQLDQQKELKAVIIGETFTRNLYPLTESYPDLLIPICGIPYIEYIVDTLLSSGVSQIIIIIKNHFNLINDYVRFNFKELIRKNKDLFHILHNEEISSIGDCLREVYKESLLQSEFILIRGMTITNFNLEKAVKFHYEVKKTDKNVSMTSLFNTYKNSYGNRTSYDENLIIIDSQTNQILQYESVENRKCCKLNGNIKFEYGKTEKNEKAERSYEVISNAYDGFIDICSVEILSHFNENFDYRNIKEDLYKNFLCSEMYLDTFYYYEIDSDTYCNTIKNIESYLKVTSELLNRWAHPLSIDKITVSKGVNINYIYSHNNVYLGVGNAKESFASQLNLLKLNSFSDFRTSTFGNFTYNDTKIQVSVDISSVISSSSLGLNTIIDENVYIRNSVLGKNCFVGKNTKVINSILLDNVEIESGVEVRNSIIGQGTKVREGVLLIKNSIFGSELDLNLENPNLDAIDNLNYDDYYDLDNCQVDENELRSSKKKYINLRINKEKVEENGKYADLCDGNGLIFNEEDDEEEEEEMKIVYSITLHREFEKGLDDDELKLMPLKKSYSGEKRNEDEDDNEEDELSECDCEREVDDENDDFEKPIREIFEKRSHDINASIEELVLLRKAFWDITIGESK